MKSLYYRSQKISSKSLVLIAVASIATIATVELCPKQNSESRRALMRSSAEKADDAFHAIHAHRVGAGHRMLRSQDPARTGMIGPSMSLVTSLPGHLDAKRTSANPNFAAVAVHYLLAAGAQPGDEVAIGCTGSFPATNIAVLSAAETMGLKAKLVSSVASSQFGANHPELTWPEMERLLADEGIIRTRSSAVSRGGFRDMAAGMTDDTREVLDCAIARSGLSMLECDSLADSIDRRMEIFADPAGGLDRYAAYINIGGGSASVGGTAGNDQLGRGLVLPAQHHRTDKPIDSVAARFLAGGVPVINMIDVVAMAREHGLPIAPTERPAVGDGGVYLSPQYRKSLASGGIVIILMLMTCVVRPPLWVSRGLSRIGWCRADANEARWMV
jgi:poly-gamma-glutamate system protein